MKMEQKPTPDQLERARKAAAEVHPYGHNSALILDGERDGTDIVQAALSAILQSDQQQAERIAELEGIVKRVQSAAKTIMIGEADELARLRDEKRADWQASKSLDSEREMNAILTAENERLEARQAELLSHAEAMAGALRLIRHQWAGHAEECAYVKSAYKAKCDCDWPMVAERCDTATNAFREWQGGRSDGPEPGSADWLKQSPNFHPGDLA